MIIILDEIPDRIDTYHTKAPFYHKLQKKHVKGSLKSILALQMLKDKDHLHNLSNLQIGSHMIHLI